MVRAPVKVQHLNIHGFLLAESVILGLLLSVYTLHSGAKSRAAQYRGYNAEGARAASTWQVSSCAWAWHWARNACKDRQNLLHFLDTC